MNGRRAVRTVLVGTRRVVTAVVAVGLTVLVVGILAIAAVGRWWEPNGGTPGTRAKARSASVAEDDTPAHEVLAAMVAADGHLLGADGTERGSRTTTRHRDLDRCDATAPALAAEYTMKAPDGSDAVVSVEIVSAGLGERTLLARTLAAHRCGGAVAAAGGPGVTAVEGLQAGRWWVMWRRGDVVVRVTGELDAAAELRAHAGELDGVLRRQLDAVCLDQQAPIDAARRNPGQPDHRPLSVTEPVTPPADVPPPDPALLTRGLPRPDGASMRTAAGFAAAPAPPSLPALGTVEVPVADPDGPGCGWAFTGMADPGPDAATVAARADQARTAATAALRDQWEAWPRQVEDWQRLVAAYHAVQRARIAAAAASTTTTAPPEPTTTTSTDPPTTTSTVPTTTTPPTTVPTTTTPPTTAAPGDGQTGSTGAD